MRTWSPPWTPVELGLITNGRWIAIVGGYSAQGSTPERALRHVQLLISWHDAPDGWRTTLARFRLWLSWRLGR